MFIYVYMVFSAQKFLARILCSYFWILDSCDNIQLDWLLYRHNLNSHKHYFNSSLTGNAMVAWEAKPTTVLVQIHLKVEVYSGWKMDQLPRRADLVFTGKLISFWSLQSHPLLSLGMNPNLLWQEVVLLGNSVCGPNSYYILENKGLLSSSIGLKFDPEEWLRDEEKSLFLSISFFSWELSLG